VRRFSPNDIRRWHRILWNHAATPILVLFSDTEVRVYSGRTLPAGDDCDVDAGGRCADRKLFEQVRLALELEQTLTSIETGEIYRREPKSFDRENTVDRYLLDNLIVLADELCKVRNKNGADRKLTVPQTQRFLIQVLFACYLIEREIVSGNLFDEHAILSHLSPKYGLWHILEEFQQAPMTARDAIFRLFGQLKKTFNGTVFAGNLTDQKARIGAGHIGLLRRFLSGDELRTGQRTLGFWAYEFRHIPIETISCIYEGFLKHQFEQEEKASKQSAESPSRQSSKRSSGLYYTPPNLAEMVVDIATADLKKRLLECRVADVACGSGVFLVAVFNRMAEHWRRDNPRRRNISRARELRELLQTNIVGLDKEETACEIACFSLYLAFLDQLSPNDVFELQEALGNDPTVEAEGVLPDILLRGNQRQKPGDPRTIVNRNFFDPDRQLPFENFDVILGNPPWVSRGKAKDSLFDDWRNSEGAENAVILAPNDDIVFGFLWNSLDLLADNGVACLLTPSTVILNQNTNKFQQRWFTKANVERMVNFADFSSILFRDAKRPCVAMRFSKRHTRDKKPSSEAWVRYDTPKVDTDSHTGETIHGYEDDVKWVRLPEIIEAAANDRAGVLWKSRLWGTGRDLRFLQRLADMPRLSKIAGKPEENKPWTMRQGFKPFRESDRKRKETPKNRWWNDRHLYLSAKTKGISYILTPEDCVPIGKSKDEGASSKEIRNDLPKEFADRPKVLCAQGARTFKVAYCPFPVLFTHSFQSVAAEPQYAHLLQFLAAVSLSDLAEYYFFQTAVNLGTERGKVLEHELLAMPFPRPEDADNPHSAKDIVNEVVKHSEEFAKKIRISEVIGSARLDAAMALQSKLEPLIQAYFGIDDYERFLIKDTLKYFKPSSTPGVSKIGKVRTLQPPTPNDRKVYVDLFCEVLNGYRSKKTDVIATGSVVLDESSGMAIVIVEQAKKKTPYTEHRGFEDLSVVIRQVAELLRQRRGSFEYHRGLKIAAEGKLYLVKPLRMKAWTRTAAMNDADEAFGAMMAKKWGGR